MSDLVIANIFSVCTACFTLSSTWIADKSKSFFLQVFQCIMYAVASYFFGVYSAIPAMLLCAVRSYLIAVDKFDLKYCVIFCVLVAVLGIFTNNSGLLGLLPLIATIQFALWCFIWKSLLASKWGILINMIIWVCYEIFVLDIASLIVDTSNIIVAIAAIIRITRMEKPSTQKEISSKENS